MRDYLGSDTSAALDLIRQVTAQSQPAPAAPPMPSAGGIGMPAPQKRSIGGAIGKAVGNGDVLNGAMSGATGDVGMGPFHPTGLYGALIGGAKGIFEHEIGGKREGGMLHGAGDGRSDSIPAQIGDGIGAQPVRVADGEFVVPADVVSALGRGSSDAGGRRLSDMVTGVRKEYADKLGKIPAPATGRGNKGLGGLFGQKQDTKLVQPSYVKDVGGATSKLLLGTWNSRKAPSQDVAGFTQDQLDAQNMTRGLATNDPTSGQIGNDRMGALGQLGNLQGSMQGIGSQIGNFDRAQGNIADAQGRVAGQYGYLDQGQGELGNAQGRIDSQYGNLNNQQGQISGAQGYLNDIIGGGGDNQKLIDATLANFDRQHDKDTAQALRTRAARGAFGERRAIAEDEESAASNLNRAQLEAGLRDQDVTRRMTAATDVGNLAGQSGQLTGQAANLAGTQGQLAGQRGSLANSGANLAGTQGQLAGQSGSLATGAIGGYNAQAGIAGQAAGLYQSDINNALTQRQVGFDNANAMGAIGQQEQQQQQNVLDAPYKRVNLGTSFISGQPLATSTSTSPGLGQVLLGAAATGAGIYAGAKNGGIMRRADGGVIDPQAQDDAADREKRARLSQSLIGIGQNLLDGRGFADGGRITDSDLPEDIQESTEKGGLWIQRLIAQHKADQQAAQQADAGGGIGAGPGTMAPKAPMVGPRKPGQGTFLANGGTVPPQFSGYSTLAPGGNNPPPDKQQMPATWGGPSSGIGANWAAKVPAAWTSGGASPMPAWAQANMAAGAPPKGGMATAVAPVGATSATPSVPAVQPAAGIGQMPAPMQQKMFQGVAGAPQNPNGTGPINASPSVMPGGGLPGGMTMDNLRAGAMAATKAPMPAQGVGAAAGSMPDNLKAQMFAGLAGGPQNPNGPGPINSDTTKPPPGFSLPGGMSPDQLRASTIAAGKAMLPPPPQGGIGAAAPMPAAMQANMMQGLAGGPQPMAKTLPFKPGMMRNGGIVKGYAGGGLFASQPGALDLSKMSAEELWNLPYTSNGRVSKTAVLQELQKRGLTGKATADIPTGSNEPSIGDALGLNSRGPDPDGSGGKLPASEKAMMAGPAPKPQMEVGGYMMSPFDQVSPSPDAMPLADKVKTIMSKGSLPSRKKSSPPTQDAPVKLASQTFPISVGAQDKPQGIGAFMPESQTQGHDMQPQVATGGDKRSFGDRVGDALTNPLTQFGLALLSGQNIGQAGQAAANAAVVSKRQKREDAQLLADQKRQDRQDAREAERLGLSKQEYQLTVQRAQDEAANRAADNARADQEFKLRQQGQAATQANEAARLRLEQTNQANLQQYRQDSLGIQRDNQARLLAQYSGKGGADPTGKVALGVLRQKLGEAMAAGDDQAEKDLRGKIAALQLAGGDAAGMADASGLPPGFQIDDPAAMRNGGMARRKKKAA